MPEHEKIFVAKTEDNTAEKARSQVESRTKHRREVASQPSCLGWQARIGSWPLLQKEYCTYYFMALLPGRCSKGMVAVALYSLRHIFFCRRHI
jgi:hypothetical protein